MSAQNLGSGTVVPPSTRLILRQSLGFTDEGKVGSYGVCYCGAPFFPLDTAVFSFGFFYMYVGNYGLPLSLCLSRVCHPSVVFRWYMGQPSSRSCLTGSGNVVLPPSLLMLLYILI